MLLEAFRQQGYLYYCQECLIFFSRSWRGRSVPGFDYYLVGVLGIPEWKSECHFCDLGKSEFGNFKLIFKIFNLETFGKFGSHRMDD